MPSVLDATRSLLSRKDTPVFRRYLRVAGAMTSLHPTRLDNLFVGNPLPQTWVKFEALLNSLTLPWQTVNIKKILIVKMIGVNTARIRALRRDSKAYFAAYGVPYYTAHYASTPIRPTGAAGLLGSMFLLNKSKA